jgi:NAD/NADP transhydrogenase alpha subunit
MKIAVLTEAAGESRCAAIPETVKKFIALGGEVAVETGAGGSASVSDAEFAAAGAKVATRGEVLKGAAIVLAVQAPDPASLVGLSQGAMLVGALDPLRSGKAIDAYAKAGIEALAMEWMPRITRAQSMDILSSQSNLAGYRAVIEAAEAYGRAFPMMMTAAGTISPAKVFVMGVGVAGLQAIASARRLGAQVSANSVARREADLRRECRWDRRGGDGRLCDRDVARISKGPGRAGIWPYRQTGHCHHHRADSGKAAAATDQRCADRQHASWQRDCGPRRRGGR